MNLKTVVFSASLLLGVSMGARAQVSVYGMVSTERIDNVACLEISGTPPTNHCSSPDNIDRTTGAGGGAYYDFKKIGAYRLGADVRGDIQKSNKTASNTITGKNALTMDEALGGLRISTTFHKGLLKPYAEGAAGWNRRSSAACDPRITNFCNVIVVRNDFLAYRAFIGLDVVIASFMDVRIPELYIGQNIGRNGVNSNMVEGGSVGVVFHLPTR